MSFASRVGAHDLHPYPSGDPRESRVLGGEMRDSRLAAPTKGGQSGAITHY